MRAAPQQVDGYDGSQRPAISNVWAGDASFPKASIGATLSLAAKPPSEPKRMHEIKHYTNPLIVRRNDKAV